MVSSAPLFRVAAVGATSLKARELGTAMEELRFPALDVTLLESAADEQAGMPLTAFAEEAAVIEPLSDAALEGQQAVFFAGPAAQAREWGEKALAQSAVVVDLSGGLAEHPQAQLFGLDYQSEALVAGERRQRLALVAHPVAYCLAQLLSAASSAGPLRLAAATVFEPASERGIGAVQELQQQTVNLLSLKPVPTDVLGAQVAFNLRAALGPEAQPSLEAVERRIASDLTGIWRRSEALQEVPVPALTVLQAPIFHAHVVSLLLVYERRPPMAALELELRAAGLSLESSTDVPQVAGTDSAQVAPPRADVNLDNACWLFVTLDNLRLATRQAVRIGAALLGHRLA